MIVVVTNAREGCWADNWESGLVDFRGLVVTNRLAQSPVSARIAGPGGVADGHTPDK